jgi:hypothetical protein
MQRLTIGLGLALVLLCAHLALARTALAIPLPWFLIALGFVLTATAVWTWVSPRQERRAAVGKPGNPVAQASDEPGATGEATEKRSGALPRWAEAQTTLNP